MGKNLINEDDASAAPELTEEPPPWEIHSSVWGLAQQAKCPQEANFILDSFKKKVIYISSISYQLCLAEMSNNLFDIVHYRDLSSLWSSFQLAFILALYSSEKVTLHSVSSVSASSLYLEQGLTGF